MKLHSMTAKTALTSRTGRRALQSCTDGNRRAKSVELGATREVLVLDEDGGRAAIVGAAAAGVGTADPFPDHGESVAVNLI